MTTQDPDTARAPGSDGSPAHRGPARRFAGDRSHLHSDPAGNGPRVLHRRHLQPTDRRGADRAGHEDRHGSRRPGDGPPPPQRTPARRAGHAPRCRLSVHLRMIHRTAREDQRPALDRDRGRQLRQHRREDDQQPLQDRVRPRPRHRRLGRHRRTRAHHPVPGPPVQREPAARAPQRRTTSRAPSSIPYHPRNQPRQDRNPTERTPTKPRTAHVLRRQRRVRTQADVGAPHGCARPSPGGACRGRARPRHASPRGPGREPERPRASPGRCSAGAPRSSRRRP